jgi:heme-degrading monooxygenase HmoA
MYARVVRFRGLPEHMRERSSSRFREQVLPAGRQQSGFKAVYVLEDRAGGKRIGVSFWESEQDAKNAAAGLDPFLVEAAAEIGAATPTPELYEVVEHAEA